MDISWISSINVQVIYMEQYSKKQLFTLYTRIWHICAWSYPRNTYALILPSKRLVSSLESQIRASDEDFYQKGFHYKWVSGFRFFSQEFLFLVIAHATEAIDKDTDWKLLEWYFKITAVAFAFRKELHITRCPWSRCKAVGHTSETSKPQWPLDVRVSESVDDGVYHGAADSWKSSGICVSCWIIRICHQWVHGKWNPAERKCAQNAWQRGDAFGCGSGVRGGLEVALHSNLLRMTHGNLADLEV